MKQKLIELLLGTAGKFLLLFLDWLGRKDIFDTALDLAKNHVQVLSGRGDLTNEQKRDEAIDRLKSDLRSGGMFLKDSAINLAIELAVAALKSVK